MSVRPTTVRRLTILFAALVALIAIGAALYLHNEHKKAALLADARAQGMAAFQAGDYRAALDNLKIYVARVKNDTDALYAYGVSRLPPRSKETIQLCR